MLKEKLGEGKLSIWHGEEDQMSFLRLLPILACIFMLGASGAAALEISTATYENYKEYLKHVGPTNQAAFAVAPNGAVSYYMYCTDSGCNPAFIEHDALRECAALSGITCSIMAYRRDVKIPFSVVPTWLPSSEEMRAAILSDDELRQLVVGNTLEGEYLNGLKWAEYFDRSGEIRGKDDEQGAYKAHWSIVGRELCFDYTNYRDWCAELSAPGSQLILIEDGQAANAQRNIVVRTGNPRGL
jgi:hypothetical protein